MGGGGEEMDGGGKATKKLVCTTLFIQPFLASRSTLTLQDLTCSTDLFNFIFETYYRLENRT